jgi:hypothetical protein
MKRFFRIITLIAMPMMLTACATVEMDWQQASQANTAEAYKFFLDQHNNPSDAHWTEANRRIEDIDLEKAKTAGNQEGLNIYLGKHPDGIHKEELRQYVAYKEALAANTEKGYMDFLGQYTQGDSVQDVTSRLRRMRYQKAVKTNSVTACETFINLYPEGEDTTEIKKLLPPLVFQETVKANNEDSYVNFIKRFPESDKVQEAAACLRKIRYEKACETATVDAYEQFLKLYPEGEDSRELEKNLPKMRSWEQSKAKQLGDIAIRMSPVASVGPIADPNSGNVQRNSSSSEPSPTLEQDLVSFRQLLKEGTDPLLVHISGFVPSGENMQGGYTLGNPGKAIPAEDGGITLMQYFKANKIKEACALLEKYNKKKSPSSPKKIVKKKTSGQKVRQARID